MAAFFFTGQGFVMKTYTHALVLVNDKQEGVWLLSRATALAQALKMKITLAHISDDYREMDYVSDSLLDDAVAEEVLKGKAMLSELVASSSQRLETAELVTMGRIGDIDKCICGMKIDLLIAGHRNRFMGAFMSRSAEYINNLNIDILITHIRS